MLNDKRLKDGDVKFVEQNIRDDNNSSDYINVGSIVDRLNENLNAFNI